MYFGFYTGIGLNMGMPYFGGMYNPCCFFPMYNPFAFMSTPIQYPQNYPQTDTTFQFMNFETDLSQIFTNNAPQIAYIKPSMFYQTYSGVTNPVDFSASSMIKTESSKKPASDTQKPEPQKDVKPEQKTEQKPEQKTEVKTEQKFSGPFEGYNEEAGKKLAEIALKNTDRFHNQCSTHVNNDIAEANLGESTDLDANNMFGQMRSNPKFKEIPASTDTKSLLAGTVLIYDKGVSGYGDWGHIEIALGDGRAASDGITKKIKPNPSALFIPIST